MITKKKLTITTFSRPTIEKTVKVETIEDLEKEKRALERLIQHIKYDSGYMIYGPGVLSYNENRLFKIYTKDLRTVNKKLKSMEKTSG